MSLPLIMQANAWAGYFVCYIAIAGIYYTNAWNASAISLHLHCNNLRFSSRNLSLCSQHRYSHPTVLYTTKWQSLQGPISN